MDRLIGRPAAEDEIQRLVAIIDSSDDAIIGKSLDGTILTWNGGAARMYGYSRAEALGQPISLVVPEDRREEVEQILERIRCGERIPPFETIRRRRDGSCLNVSVTVSPVHDANGHLVGASSIARDITEQKRAKAALRESEDRFETFMAQLPAMVFIKDSDSRLLYANPMLKELFGWGDAVGRHTTELLPPEMAEAMVRDDRRVMEQGPEVIHERVLDVHGKVHDVETRKFPFRNSRGEVLLGGITIDETLRRQAEEALRDSEDRFRLLLDSAAEAIYGIDLQGKCSFCNEACVRQLGYAGKDELLGQNMHWQIHHSHRDGTPFDEKDCRIFQAFRSGVQAHVADEVLWRADGSCFDAEYWSYPQVRHGQVVGAVVSFLDITERKRAEELVATQRRRLADIVEGTNVGTWEWNVQTGETVFNERWAEIVGYTLEELAPVSLQTWMSLAHPDDIKVSEERIQQHFRGETAHYECEVRMRHKDGHWVWILDRGKVAARTAAGQPLLMSGTHQDITERKQAEEQLATQKERLASILEGTDVGSWEWNVQTGETVYNERWAEMVGYTLEELRPVSAETWLSLVHPKDKDRSLDAAERHFRGELDRYECEVRLRHKDGHWVWILDRGKVASWTEDGQPLLMFGTHQDITERKRAEVEREKLVQDLQAALAQVRTLGGLIPICSSCKKIRDDRGYWNILEAYITEHSEAKFSHGICPECEAKLFAQYFRE